MCIHIQFCFRPGVHLGAPTTLTFMTKLILYDTCAWTPNSVLSNLRRQFLGFWDIYAGWGYLGLPLITGNPGIQVYLCWLGLPGATSDYRNSWDSGISMLAGATGATWGYL